MREGRWVDLGRMRYAPCFELQRKLLEGVVGGSEAPTLLFVEHEPVLSLGAGFHEENLLLSREEYARRGIEVHPTDRGGDVTFHGPNQLVAYPTFPLAWVDQDLHRWMRTLEESVIVALRDFGLKGERFPPLTGVWVGGRKVCAIGIKVRRWVSMHGLALNCNNDLSPFDLIVPCGIQGYSVTSVSRESGREVTTQQARESLLRAFEGLLNVSLEVEGREALLIRLLGETQASETLHEPPRLQHLP